MLKNNIELDVKVKCIEGNTTQAKVAEEVGTSASYVSRVINGGDKVVNKTFVSIMEALGYNDLSKAQLPPIYKRDGRDCYLDPIRQKLIFITPEETVRQISYFRTSSIRTMSGDDWIICAVPLYM